MDNFIYKGAIIFNAGDRGGRISKTNRNFFSPHLLNVITFATPFQGRQKFHTPLLGDLSKIYMENLNHYVA